MKHANQDLLPVVGDHAAILKLTSVWVSIYSMHYQHGLFFFSFLEIHLPEHLWINETQLHARENGRQGKSSSRMSVQRYKVIQFSERKVIPCAPWERISGEARESQRAETGPHWGQVFGHSLIAIKQNQPKHNSFKQSVYFAYDI